MSKTPHPTRTAPASPSPARGEGKILPPGGEHDLRQKLLALVLRAVTLHGRGETLQNAVLERRDDGVMHIALAADRRRIGELVGGGADRLQHLALAAAGALCRRNPRQRFQRSEEHT